MQYAHRVERIGGEGAAAWRIHISALEARARGEDVIVLSVGDPDFATPDVVVERAISALREGDTHYTGVVGRPELRGAISSYANRVSGLGVGPENICVTAGAQNGLFVASLLCLDPGDEVLILDPCYVTYEATVRISGAIPVYVPPKAGFRPDLEAIAKAVTPRTKAIVFANPNNPTGVALAGSELTAIAEIACADDLWVVSDEVYNGLTYDVPHSSIAALPGMAERTVTISSLSKTHAMTGWRIGWLIAPEELVSHAANLSLAMHYGLPGYAQQAAVTALQEVGTIIAEMKERYRARRDVLYAALESAPGLVPLMPDAGMFVLADIRGTGLSSQEFAWELFKAEGVSVLDGAAFGASAAGFVRLSCTINQDNLREAGERITRFCRTLVSEKATEDSGQFEVSLRKSQRS